VIARATPLDATIEAHGGLKTWQAFGSFSSDLRFTIGGKAIVDHQQFDLKSRTGLVSNADYAIGFDGKSVWFDPTTENALRFPPKFYLSTPFYFFGIPFVFADPGAQSERLPDPTFKGSPYQVIKVTFANGTGDSPDDTYLVYVEPETARVHLVIYTVTYFARAAGQPLDNVPTNVIVYDQWESVAGLSVPRHANVYQWKTTPVRRSSTRNSRSTISASWSRSPIPKPLPDQPAPSTRLN
jgi:hypothetical protein